MSCSGKRRGPYRKNISKEPEDNFHEATVGVTTKERKMPPRPSISNTKLSDKLDNMEPLDSSEMSSLGEESPR